MLTEVASEQVVRIKDMLVRESSWSRVDVKNRRVQRCWLLGRTIWHPLRQKSRHSLREGAR